MAYEFEDNCQGDQFSTRSTRVRTLEHSSTPRQPSFLPRKQTEQEHRRELALLLGDSSTGSIEEATADHSSDQLYIKADGSVVTPDRLIWEA